MLAVIDWINSNGILIASVVGLLELIIGASPLKANSTIAMIFSGVKNVVGFLKKKEPAKLA